MLLLEEGMHNFQIDVRNQYRNLLLQSPLMSQFGLEIRQVTRGAPNECFCLVLDLQMKK